MNWEPIALPATADKLTRAGAELFEIDEYDQPFVAGCSAWLACKLITEAHNQQTYDLFIGEIVGAWSDTRVFKNGHWQLENWLCKWVWLMSVFGRKQPFIPCDPIPP